MHRYFSSFVDQTTFPKDGESSPLGSQGIEGPPMQPPSAMEDKESDRQSEKRRAGALENKRK